MHYLIEIWTPKPEWQVLTKTERGKFMTAMGEKAMAVAQSEQVEVLSWSVNDCSAAQPSKHAYFAIWRAQQSYSLRRLLQAVEAGGWYQYFDQKNLLGEGATPDSIIENLVSL